MQQDSIIVDHISTASFDTVSTQPARPQTPYQVLRLLPKDATPAQQDSAIQAWFQPGEIHYSEQPDTLHLPGHEIPRDLKDVNLPQDYRESFFLFIRRTDVEAETNILATQCKKLIH